LLAAMGLSVLHVRHQLVYAQYCGKGQ
jgi:hypothetical protein